MESKNYFIPGNFLIWCIENELWKENVKIEDWLLSITSGNFLMVNFCKPIYLIFLCSQDAQKTCLHFLGVLGTLPNLFLKKQNDKFKHCDVLTFHYLEPVSIFTAKTFFGHLECIIEQFNRNPLKFNEGITI